MFHATTILAYKGPKGSIIGGDGQVSFGQTVLKANATKIRKLNGGKILAGFAGSTADAFNLFDMFERILEGCKGDLMKARKLEAMMLVLNREHIFILTGTGDVVEPEDGCIAAIGSGGNYALAAARALHAHQNELKINEEELVKQALNIAGDICIYTNNNIKTYSLWDEQNG